MGILSADLREAREYLLRQWGSDGKRVIAACESATSFGGSTSEFLGHCTACGGDWGAMFLSGIRELYPVVYDAIPDDMGAMAFVCLCHVLQLCGVDTSK